MTNGEVQRCAVVTGASAGVGKAAATMLVAQGWHVIAHGRDRARTEAARDDIAAAARNGGRIDMLRADLALLSETAAMADAIHGLTPHVHALLNNAGGVSNSRTITPEGNEATFAGNHLGHFLLTRRLLPLLHAAATPGDPARIVSVSSEGHRSADPIDWDDIQRKTNWISGRAYTLAKLCNILFTRELARREAARHIVANAMHPGEVASNFASHAVPEMKAYMDTLDLLPPEVSARTLVWLASAPETARESGGYFHDLAPLAAAPAALDDEAAARLWQESERLVAQAGF